MDEGCDYCKEKDSDLTLTSGHQICSRCFSELAQKSQIENNKKEVSDDR